MEEYYKEMEEYYRKILNLGGVDDDLIFLAIKIVVYTVITNVLFNEYLSRFNQNNIA